MRWNIFVKRETRTREYSLLLSRLKELFSGIYINEMIEGGGYHHAFTHYMNYGLIFHIYDFCNDDKIIDRFSDETGSRIGKLFVTNKDQREKYDWVDERRWLIKEELPKTFEQLNLLMQKIAHVV